MCSCNVSRILDRMLLLISELVSHCKHAPKNLLKADASTVSEGTVLLKLHVITKPFESTIGLAICLSSAVFLQHQDR